MLLKCVCELALEMHRNTLIMQVATKKEKCLAGR